MKGKLYMKYYINWVDATLKENWTKEEIKKGIRVDDGIFKKIEGVVDGWIDYEATYCFEAKNDKQAIALVKQFTFEGRNVDVFSLLGDNGVIYTEEELELEKDNREELSIQEWICIIGCILAFGGSLFVLNKIFKKQKQTIENYKTIIAIQEDRIDNVARLAKDWELECQSSLRAGFQDDDTFASCIRAEQGLDDLFLLKY